MKCYISVVCVLSAFVALSVAAPAVLEDTKIAPVHNQVKRQTDNSELLNRVITYSNNKLQQLRRLFPQLFQVLDAVIQNVTSQVFRVVGGALLRSGGLGGGGSSSSSGGSRVSVVLPTFPPDEDEDEDEDEEDEDVDTDIRGRLSSNSTSSSASTSVAISLNNPITTTDNNEIDGNEPFDVSSSSITTVSSTPSSTDTETTPGSTTTTTVSSALFTSPTLSEDTNSVKRHIRLPRETDDQDVAASENNAAPDPASDLSNVETEDADRNKRFLPFGGGDGHSGGGSGNFLFDLIRNTADRAARTVGTVYRMVAGTENLGFGLSATATSSKTVAAAPDSQLVSGSGATEESDEKDAGVGGVAEIDVSPKAHPEGIPGPITRLLVVANRGIANLIQDLILRLAQTSERIVNFKARLVTALI